MIRGLVYWFGCSLPFFNLIFKFFFLFSLFVSVCMHASLCDFIYLGLLLPFVLGFSLFNFLSVFFSFLFFFLPFLPSHVAGRVLVLGLGVGPEPPRWKS